MKKIPSKSAIFSLLFPAFLTTVLLKPIFAEDKDHTADSQKSKAQILELITEVKTPLYAGAKQLTFVGPRSGEGYFSADGKKMIFQSEREPGNPFYQMYILDLASGKTGRVSPGKGKTTCGWIHPEGKKVLWSSTHLDREISKKVKDEFAERNKPVKGRYSWSFDDQFDIFESDLSGKNLKRLTKEKGYDAEGSYSPDGQWIAFASNRSMYTDSFDEKEKKLLERDPSYAMEIYLMRADGTQVKRLTTSKGYDGGPFFSADGKKLTWRRFSADGMKAEVYTMNIDGTEQKAVTHLGAMSWAPYFHPSGDYIIFASSVLGFANFELFIVDTEGQKKPVRVTFNEGFDGLASFSPDGKTLTWSHRNEKGESQIYLASWNDELAREALQLPKKPQQDLQLSTPLSLTNVKSTVSYLASEQFEGRMTGSKAEKFYTQKIADLFKQWGLKPALKSGFIQPFEFISGIHATEKNRAEFKGRLTQVLVRSQDYQVLSFSSSGSFPAAPVVFAGFGMKVPPTDKFPAYDSFKDLDVQGKWVVVFEGQPQTKNRELNQHLLTFSPISQKATVAKNRGAVGVLVITDSGLKNLKFDGRLAVGSLPVLKISEQVFSKILSSSDKNQLFPSLQALKDKLQQSEFETLQFPLSSQYFTAEVDLQVEKSLGHNVIAKLDLGPKGGKGLILGAHGDHLGRGQSGNSLARSEEQGQIHYGADDNASGVAGVLELAQYFSQPQVKRNFKKPLYFAVWSGEELGILGSAAFTKAFAEESKKPLQKTLEASLNMDMIGRLRDSLQVQGVASAKEWSGLSEEVGLLSGLSLSLTSDPHLPTDAMTFYLTGVPSISFFTGAHSEYHSPRDTAESLNYEGLLKVIGVVKSYVEKLAFTKAELLHYQKVEGNSGQKLEGRSFRIFLGTIPDYTQEGIRGVRISGVSKNSPAEKAGLKTNDVITEFDKTKIENLYDYVYTLQAVKPDKPTKIKVTREGQSVEFDITPALKE